MELNHHKDHHCGLKLAYKIARVALHAATVAAAFLLVEEVHKVHHALKKEK